MEASSNNDFVHETGLASEEVAKRYSKWAKDYDKDLSSENFHGPNIIADHMNKLFPDSSSRSQINILDVAAGTGRVGEELNPLGFSKIDALEPSEGMLNCLKEKNIYTNTFLEYFDGNLLPIVKDTYDVAIISGGMGEGHIPCKALNELPRMVKPGGLVLIVMREAYLQSVEEYRDRLEPYLARMESTGLWKMVSRTVIPKYSFDNNGILYTFKVE